MLTKILLNDIILKRSYFMDAITSWDLSVLHFVENNFQNPFLTFFFKIFTYASEAGIIWIVFAVLLLVSKKYRKQGFFAAVALILCLLIVNITVKNIVARPRPFAIDEFSLLISRPGEFSFPSGHTTVSFCGALFLTLTNKKWAVPAYIVAVLTAFSRIYFTVHYPTDVFAGMIFGTVVALIAYYLCKLLEKKTGFFETKFFSAEKKK